MLPAKYRNTGHMVIMALIKQNWQALEADCFNQLHQSCCYKTDNSGEYGNQCAFDGLGSWLQQTDLAGGACGEGAKGRTGKLLWL